MLMMLFFINPMSQNFWKKSLNFIIMSIMMMKFPMNFYLSSVSMNVGTDLLSLMMIFLTIIIFSISFLTLKNMNNSNYLYFLMLMLFKILFLCFSFSSFLYFYFFFELSLIPMLYIILGWGFKVERTEAGIYFMFYTSSSSLPLLFCLMIFFYNFSSFYIYLMNIYFLNDYFYIFFICFGFLVKMPIFLFHLWLPKAHVEAPVMGSMILASVLLKLGSYGIFRILFILKEYMYMISPFIISFSMWGGLLISFSCLNQLDLKVIVAFSSVSHMSMLISGMFSSYNLGMFSSYMMMISHGFTSSGLFYLINIMYERTKSRSLMKNKGLMNIFPNYSFVFFIIMMSSMGTPPTINFFSELFLSYSLMCFNMLFLIMLFMLLWISTCYSIYMFCYSQHGKLFLGKMFMKDILVIDYFILLIHWFPTVLLTLKMEMLFCMM